jgi:hypothetical protein
VSERPKARKNLKASKNNPACFEWVEVLKFILSVFKKKQAIISILVEA